MSSDLLQAQSVDAAQVEDSGIGNDPAVTSVSSSTVAAPREGTTFLPEKYSSDPSLKDFKDISAFADSYLHLKRQVGRSVVIPGKDAGKEDMDKFYNRITSIEGVIRSPDENNSEAMEQFYNGRGRPSESNGYEIDFGDDSKHVDANTLNSFKEIAHKAGLNTQQFKQIVDFDLQRAKVQQDLDQNAATNAISVLQQRWGKEYHNRVAGASAAYKTYQKQFPEGFEELNRVAKNNPALVAILADVGRSMQDKGYIDAPHAYGGVTPEEAEEQINEIRNNSSHAYHAKNQGAVGPAAHNAAREKMRRLYKIRYPEG